MKHTPKFVISYPSQRHEAPSCFPVGYDMTNLARVTYLSGSGEWATYINTQTGEKIDCAVFAKQMLDLDREW